MYVDLLAPARMRAHAQRETLDGVSHANESYGLDSAELPRVMPIVYAGAALLSTPVFSPNVFDLEGAALGHAFAGNALAFAAVAVAVHLANHLVLRRVLP